jgi:hypothetical protein
MKVPPPIPQTRGETMRVAVIGALMALGVVLVVSAGFPAAIAAPEARPARTSAANDRAGPTSDLIALSSEVDGRQQVTLIDPRARVIAVYHVDRATGGLALKSVRNIQWDLLIEEFNAANPTPREVRALTEQPR